MEGKTSRGKKCFIPYGLYRCHGSISAKLANKTGFNEDDLELFFQSLEYMFDHDRSAARGIMHLQQLYIFKHSSILGNASSQTVFDKIKVKRKADVTVARQFSDYEITIEEMPKGVTLIERS